MTFKNAICLALSLVAVSGCARNLDSSVRRYQKAEWSKITKTDIEHCRAKGGTYKGVGIVGTPSCVTPFIDADKVCHDSHECMGKCTVALDGSASEGKRTVGICEADDAHFGCFAEIANGLEQLGECVD